MAQQKNNAKFYDPALFIQLGFNPKTGLPLKYDPGSPSFQPANLLLLTEIDKADALQRYVWRDLPPGLTGEMIERVLYYRGQGAFFYMKENDRFYFLPYTLAHEGSGSSLDCYGRYKEIVPLLFNGSFDEKDPKAFINGMTKKCIYDLHLDLVTTELQDTSCVLLHDRAIGISQTVAPRASLQQPLLELMSGIPCYLNTALKNESGVKGMKVSNEADSANVTAANISLDQAALRGQWAVPIVGSMDFQELTGNAPGRAEDYLLVMQALDSYRLSQYGLPNGGLFQKKAHMLEAEQNMNTGTASLVLQEGLKQRQNAIDIFNSIHGTHAKVDINESLIQLDNDGDGDFYDSNSGQEGSEEIAQINEMEDMTNDEL